MSNAPGLLRRPLLAVGLQGTWCCLFSGVDDSGAAGWMRQSVAMWPEQGHWARYTCASQTCRRLSCYICPQHFQHKPCAKAYGSNPAKVVVQYSALPTCSTCTTSSSSSGLASRAALRPLATAPDLLTACAGALLRLAGGSSATSSTSLSAAGRGPCRHSDTACSASGGRLKVHLRCSAGNASSQ